MPTLAQKAPQTKSAASATPHRAHPERIPALSAAHRLQRTIGNQALLRMLQAHARNTKEDAAVKAPPRGDAPVRIQPKLKVNAPGDFYEQEADRIAEHVMCMPQPRTQSEAAADTMASPAQVQTSTVPAAGGGGFAAPPIVDEVLSSPGQPLDSATRAFMEPRFGEDFSRVRVHTDAQAAESASAINARAFTVNRNIVFGSAEYLPASDSGRQLLSHELAHVLQQSVSTRSLGSHSTDTEAMRDAGHVLQRQPKAKQQKQEAGIPRPYLDQVTFQKLLEKWSVLDKLKHPLVDELAKAYVSRPGKPSDMPSMVIRTQIYEGSERHYAGHHEPDYGEVYNAIFGVFDIKKVDKSGKVTEWTLGEVANRPKSLGEQTEEGLKFVAGDALDTVKEELAKEALEAGTAMISTRWAAGRVLVGVLELVPGVGEAILTAMLALDVYDLYKSLGEPADLSTGNQKRADIIAAVKAWLLGNQEAAEREKRLRAPLQVRISPVVADKTAFGNY
jgi:hypothetical protein